MTTTLLPSFVQLSVCTSNQKHVSHTQPSPQTSEPRKRQRSSPCSAPPLSPPSSPAATGWSGSWTPPRRPAAAAPRRRRCLRCPPPPRRRACWRWRTPTTRAAGALLKLHMDRNKSSHAHLIHMTRGTPPPTAPTAIPARFPAGSHELLYGCEDGRVVQLMVDRGAVRQGFVIPPPAGGGAVRAMHCGADYSKVRGGVVWLGWIPVTHSNTPFHTAEHTTNLNQRNQPNQPTTQPDSPAVPTSWWGGRTAGWRSGTSTRAGSRKRWGELAGWTKQRTAAMGSMGSEQFLFFDQPCTAVSSHSPCHRCSSGVCHPAVRVHLLRRRRVRHQRRRGGDHRPHFHGQGDAGLCLGLTQRLTFDLLFDQRGG